MTAITRQQAEFTVRLWKTGHFDSLEIAGLVQIPEHVVCRIVHTTRSIERQWRRMQDDRRH